MVTHRAFAIAAVLCSLTFTAAANDNIIAIRRTNAENYKDRVLATCLSVAYKGSSAGEDADITKSAFLEWTCKYVPHPN